MFLPLSFHNVKKKIIPSIYKKIFCITSSYTVADHGHCTQHFYSFWLQHDQTLNNNITTKDATMNHFALTNHCCAGSFQNMIGVKSEHQAKLNWLIISPCCTMACISPPITKTTTTITHVPERTLPQLLHHTCPLK